MGKPGDLGAISDGVSLAHRTEQKRDLRHARMRNSVEGKDL